MPRHREKPKCRDELKTEMLKSYLCRVTFNKKERRRKLKKDETLHLFMAHMATVLSSIEST